MQISNFLFYIATFILYNCKLIAYFIDSILLRGIHKPCSEECFYSSRLPDRLWGAHNILTIDTAAVSPAL
jgi:hypothetical protein